MRHPLFSLYSHSLLVSLDMCRRLMLRTCKICGYSAREESMASRNPHHRTNVSCLTENRICLFRCSAHATGRWWSGPLCAFVIDHSFLWKHAKKQWHLWSCHGQRASENPALSLRDPPATVWRNLVVPEGEDFTKMERWTCPQCNHPLLNHLGICPFWYARASC